MTKKCTCGTSFRCSLEEFPLDVRIQAHFIKSADAEPFVEASHLNIDTIKVLEMARADSQNMAQLLADLSKHCKNMAVVSVCDIRAHVQHSSSRGSTGSSESCIETAVVKQFSHFLKRVFVTENVALCQVSGTYVSAIDGDTEIFTHYAVLTPLGALQAVLYMENERNTSNKSVNSIWKQCTRSSSLRAKPSAQPAAPSAIAATAKSSKDENQVAATVSQSSSFSSQAVKPLMRRKTLPINLGQAAPAVAAPARLRLQPSTDHIKSLQALQDHHDNSDSEASYVTTMSGYRSQEVSSADSQSTTAWLPIQTKEQGKEANGGEMGGIALFQTGQSALPAEEESMLFPALRSPYPTLQAVPITEALPMEGLSNSKSSKSSSSHSSSSNREAEIDTNSDTLFSNNFFYTSATGDESYLHPPMTAAASIYASPDTDASKSNKYSAGIFSYVTNAYSYGISSSSLARANPVPQQLVASASVEDQDDKTVSTLEDMLVDQEQEAGKEESNLSFSSYSTNATATVHSLVLTPTKPTSTAEGKVEKVDNAVIVARRELLHGKLEAVQSQLAAIVSPSACSSLVARIEECIIYKTLSPMSCGKMLAAMFAEDIIQQASSYKSSKSKSRKQDDHDGMYEKLSRVLEAGMCCRLGDDASSIEACCYLSIIHLVFSIETMQTLLLQHENKPSQRFAKSIGSNLHKVVDRFVLASSSPELNNTLRYPLLDLPKHFSLSAEQHSAMCSKVAAYHTDPLGSNVSNVFLSPISQSITSNGVNVNKPLHLLLFVLRNLYSSQMVYEHLQELLEDYDFASKALKESPIRVKAKDKDLSENKMLAVMKMLGKRKSNSSDNELQEAIEKENVQPAPAPIAAPAAPVTAAAVEPTASAQPVGNSLLSRKKTVSHRMNMKTNIIQAITLPAAIIYPAASRGKAMSNSHTSSSSSSHARTSIENRPRKHMLASPTPLAKRARRPSSGSTPSEQPSRRQVIADTPMDQTAGDRRITRSAQSKLGLAAGQQAEAAHGQGVAGMDIAYGMSSDAFMSPIKTTLFPK